MDNKTQSILLGVIAAVVLICGAVYLDGQYEEHRKAELRHENYKRAAEVDVKSPGVKPWWK